MEGASADTRARRNWQSARPFCGMVLAAGLLCALIACTEMNGLGMRAGLRGQAKQPKAANRSECFQLLLVVIFNQPHFYGNIPFLKKLYGNTFKHMVVYGAPPVPAGVHKTADTSGGYFQQNTLIAAMTDYPKFDGYLFIGDDVWLNYPQLLSTMDLNKIWLNPDNETNFVEPSKFVKTDWVNWLKGFGLPEVRKHYDKVPKKFSNRSKEAFGHNRMVIKSFSDVVYIPRRFSTNFIAVAGLFPGVIFEIAIPTTLHLISNSTDVQYFSDALYLWYDGKRNHVWDFWSMERTFIHPVKLGDMKLRTLSEGWTKKCIEDLSYKVPVKLTCTRQDRNITGHERTSVT